MNECADARCRRRRHHFVVSKSTSTSAGTRRDRFRGAAASTHRRAPSAPPGRTRLPALAEIHLRGEFIAMRLAPGPPPIWVRSTRMMPVAGAPACSRVCVMPPMSAPITSMHGARPAFSTSVPSIRLLGPVNSRHEGRRRLAIDFGRRAILLDRAAVDHARSVRRASSPRSDRASPSARSIRQSGQELPQPGSRLRARRSPSRSPSGSSSSSTAGSPTSARASATRRRSKVDSCAGSAARGRACRSAQRQLGQRVLIRSPAPRELGIEGDVVEHGLARRQRVGPEHECRCRASAPARRSRGAASNMAHSPIRIAPACGCSSPAMARSSAVLPLPGSKQRGDPGRWHLQRDILENIASAEAKPNHDVERIARTSTCSILARLEAAEPAHDERRDQRDEGDAQQRRRDRALHQHHRIAEADRQRAAQLRSPPSGRGSGRPPPARSDSRSAASGSRARRTRPASISSTTEAWPRSCPWWRTPGCRHRATAAGSRAAAPTARPAAG